MVLFVGTEPSGRTDLYTTDDRGVLPDRLTGDLAALDEGATIVAVSDTALYPVPSQDGSTVLFALDHQDGSPYTLHEVEVFGRAVRDLGEAPAGLHRALYDRTGARILLDVRDPVSGRAGLSILDEDGPTSLSPDGAELTFDGFFPDDDRVLVRVGSGDERKLAVLDLTDRSLTPFGGAEGLELLAPRLSPGGEDVLFPARTSPDDCYDLFTVAVDQAGETTPVAEPEPLGVSEATWEAVYGESGAPGDHEPGEPSEGGDGGEGSGDDATPAPGMGCLSVWAPSWAADASGRVAFLATTDPLSGRTDAFVLDLATATITAASQGLGEGGSGVSSWPRWAPDGQAFLFSLSEAGATDDAPQTVDLWISTDDGQARGLTDGYAGVPSLAQWGADGASILFWARSSSGDTASDASDASLIDVETGAIRALTAGRGLHVSFPLWLERNPLLY